RESRGSCILNAAPWGQMQGASLCRRLGIRKRRAVRDPSPDQWSNPHLALISSPVIEESSHPILHFGRDVAVSQGSNRADGPPVRVQEGDRVGEAIQMRLECQGCFGGQSPRQIIREKSRQLFASHRNPPVHY